MITLPSGARVCFVGDSITANNDYISYIQDHFYKNRKNDGIKFYNCGVSGGNCVTQLTYFDDDTLRHKPTHIFIMLGVNDSWRDRLYEPKGAKRYELLKERYELFKENYEKLYLKAKSTGAEAILMTPAPYAEYAESEVAPLKGGYALIMGYAHFVESFARNKGCELIDIHGYITEVMQSENIYNPDRVHPNPKGQYYLAKCILEAMGEMAAEYAPFPQYLLNLREKVRLLRGIYFTELVIIGDYGMPEEEKIKKVKEYLTLPSPAFEVQANIYLSHRENKQELYNEIEAILREGFD